MKKEIDLILNFAEMGIKKTNFSVLILSLLQKQEICMFLDGISIRIGDFFI